MACQRCSRSRLTLPNIMKVSVSEVGCAYTMAELKDILSKLTDSTDKSIVQSQINIYKTSCNAFKDQIDGLVKKL